MKKPSCRELLLNEDACLRDVYHEIDTKGYDCRGYRPYCDAFNCCFHGCMVLVKNKKARPLPIRLIHSISIAIIGVASALPTL